LGFATEVQRKALPGVSWQRLQGKKRSFGRFQGDSRGLHEGEGTGVPNGISPEGFAPGGKNSRTPGAERGGGTNPPEKKI